MVRIMASLSMTKARGCPECGQVHDCAWFVEMQVLTKRLDDKINELVKYVKDCDKAGLTTPEIPELEDK